MSLRFQLLALTLALAACSATGQDSAGSAGADAVAVIDGEEIRVDDLEIRGELIGLEQKIYEAKMQGLEEKIGEILVAKEAAARGMSSEELLAAEVDAKIAPPTDDEVVAFYEQQKARIGRPLEDVRGQIADLLGRMRAQEVRQTFINGLRSKADVQILLDPPRVEVDLSSAPMRGAEDAPVTIVEISDFQCPFCRRVQPTLARVQEKYGEQVRWSFKDLPLNSIHPEAQKAAEAARCAGDQGKFWEYRAALFEAGSITSELHEETADKLGLDKGDFDECLASDKYRAAVESDTDEAASLGITGTPAFVINGIMLSGAQPFEAFERIIDRELERAN